MVKDSESLYIKAKCGIILSEIYVPSIYSTYYGDNTVPTNIEETWDNINNLPITYSNPYMILNGNGSLVLPVPLPKNIEIEYIIKHHDNGTNSGEFDIYKSYDGTSLSSMVFRIFFWYNYIGISTTMGYWANYPQSSSSEHRIKIRIQDSTITVWHNNSQFASKSGHYLPDKLYLAFKSETVEYIKEISIKAL